MRSSGRGMRNVALEVAYDGTSYSGWQVQDNAVTVQGIMEEALARIGAFCGEAGAVTGLKSGGRRLRCAGRTDAGVHALGQVASFFTESRMTAREFQLALNSLIPFDIRVLRVFDAPAEFHPRFGAKRRWYRYLVYNTDILIPFFRNYALWLARKVDLDRLNGYARRILGAHDFTSFASLETDEDPIREVYSCEFTRKGEFIIFDIAANSFLRKMVRTIVGTFFEMEKQGEGEERVDEILDAKDRSEAGSTAFPGGLYLVKVFY